MLHAAKLANGQAFAGGLQFLVAESSFLPASRHLAAASCAKGHSAVTRDVFLGLLVTMSS
jgi:hypothetical protein